MAAAIEEGEALRTAREATGFTQEALAGAAGVSRRTIQNVESGLPASFETIRALKAVLGDYVAASSAAAEAKALVHRLVAPASSERAWNVAAAGRWAGVAGIVLSSLAVLALTVHLPDGSPVRPWLPILAVPPSVLLLVSSFASRFLRDEDDVFKEKAAFREMIRIEGLPSSEGPEPQVRT